MSDMLTCMPERIQTIEMQTPPLSKVGWSRLRLCSLCGESMFTITSHIQPSCSQAVPTAPVQFVREANVSHRFPHTALYFYISTVFKDNTCTYNVLLTTTVLNLAQNLRKAKTDTNDTTTPTTQRHNDTNVLELRLSP